MTAEYTTDRKQFGKPLATFQAVAQRAADAFIWVEGMRWTTWQAVWRLAEGQAGARGRRGRQVLGRRGRPLHHLRRAAPARRHRPRRRLPGAPLLPVVEADRAVARLGDAASGAARAAHGGGAAAGDVSDRKDL